MIDYESNPENLNVMTTKTTTNDQVLEKLHRLYNDVFSHDGYADLRIEMRILKRGQKEVILHCGKQYRYIVDFDSQKSASANAE